jgi:hypothetical protein
MMAAAQTPAEVVRAHFARYLGPFTAKNAVRTVAKQSFGIEADHLTREQVPTLLDALGPLLRTLLGKEGAERVAGEIRRELAL